MDAACFDDLARSFTETRPRRGIARGLVGLGVMNALAPWRPNNAASRKKHKKKKCKGKKRKCGKKCIPKANCCKSADCGAIETCTSGDCVPLVCGNGGACRVFVTSTTHNGNLGGLLGADAICQTRAAAGGIPGTYKAWLSDTFQSAATRLTHATGPYQLLNGVTVANNWNDLTDGALSAAIQVTETGSTVNAPQQWVWTNTNGNGAASGGAPDSCLNWTTSASSESGDNGVVIPDQANDAWTRNGVFKCSLSARLYCFQQS